MASPGALPGLPDFARVSEALYRGGQPSAAGFERLGRMGVKTIIDLRGQSHRDNLMGLGLKYFHIPSSVSHPDAGPVLEFLRIVCDPANQPVFVHGARGGDRTGLYVAAYRMVEQGWTARDALAELPRFGFDPYWKQVPTFLAALDCKALRNQLDQPLIRRAQKP